MHSDTKGTATKFKITVQELRDTINILQVYQNYFLIKVCS